MISIARAHGITPVLATFVWKTAMAGEGGENLLERCMRMQNAIMRRVASEDDVALADVERRFEVETGGFVDAVHLTELGNREIARIVSHALRPDLDRALRPATAE
jgi:hypothetical protein